jgi:hypothetical protein
MYRSLYGEGLVFGYGVQHGRIFVDWDAIPFGHLGVCLLLRRYHYSVLELYDYKKGRSIRKTVMFIELELQDILYL